MEEEYYTSSFYNNQREGSLKSARKIIPIVIELVSPKSVIDVGCGVGTFLKIFKEYGIDNVLGIDGDYVNKEMLEIPPENFKDMDLKKKLQLNKRFDLVISLEVAEHLPPKSAPSFIESLVSLGSVVLFSAAIPHQGGTNHINEQWPEYWRKLFMDYGYVPADCIRRKLWNDNDVNYWYAQNILIYVKEEELNNYPKLKERYDSSHQVLSLVHPKKYHALYTEKSEDTESLRSLLKAMPKAIRRMIRIRLGRIFERTKTRQS